MAITVPVEPRSKARSPMPTSRRRAPTAADEVKPEGTPLQTTFNFFGLSRELRDMVYDFSLTFKRKIRSQHGARLRGRMVTEASLLLVSKQFSREYFERAQYHTCLIIVDRPEFHGDSFKIPRAISYARNVELFLAIACDSPDHFTDQCRVVKEVRMHRKWIVDLCQKMRRLESISIKLITDPHQHIEACEAKLLELQHKLTNFEELKNLAVYHCDYAGKETGWSFASKRTLVMEWSAKDGELHRVEAAKASPELEKNDSGRTFDLFGLPREMRNAIYDEVLANVSEIRVGNQIHLRISVQNAMPITLALVSRQFSKECKERERNACVILKDTKLWHPFEGLEIPAIPSTVTLLELHMALTVTNEHHIQDCRDLDFCEIEHEIDLHCSTAKTALAQLPQIRALSMHLYIVPSGHQGDDLSCALAHQGRLKNVHNLTAFTVRQCPMDGGSVFEFSAACEVVARWSSGG
ncbi:hypothetical protein LTR29_006372 [Friedmanniomyces endolithicus]|nr:hypothetical protein LTR29_006372 [Friedmanniomyces endolithicus]